jgi:predicted transcriptional regulator
METKSYFEMILDVSHKWHINIVDAVKIVNQSGIYLRKTGAGAKETSIEVVQLLLNENLTVRGIANLIGLTYNRVNYMIQQGKVQKGKVSGYLAVRIESKRDITAKAICELIKKNKTLEEISNELKLSESTIRRYAHDYKMPALKDSREYKLNEKYNRVQMLIKQDCSIPYIAEELHMTKQAVYSYCKNHNIEYKKNKRNLKVEIKELIDDGYSIKEIANKLDTEYEKVYAIARYHKFNCLNNRRAEIATDRLYKLIISGKFNSLGTKEILTELELTEKMYYHLIENNPELNSILRRENV